MPRRWPQHQEEQLRSLLAGKQHTYVEIAKLMGLKKTSIQLKAGEMGLKNPVYRLRKTKHKHLRHKLLEFYLSHSAKECQERFSLTPSEFKSCLTVAYRDPKLAHIRKDTRRHDSWSLGESLDLLKRSGVQPRIMIAKRLRRGGVHSVKEQLSRLGTGSKNLNGMPAKYVRAAFPLHVDRLPFIKTLAGPTGKRVPHARGAFEFVIVPWVALRPLLRCRIDPLLKRYIRIMSNYQRWIYGGKPADSIVRSIKRYAKETPCSSSRNENRRVRLPRPR